MAGNSNGQVSAAALAAFKASITTGTFKVIAAAAQERDALARAAAIEARAKPVADSWVPMRCRPRPIAVMKRNCPRLSDHERALAIAEFKRITEEL